MSGSGPILDPYLLKAELEKVHSALDQSNWNDEELWSQYNALQQQLNELTLQALQAKIDTQAAQLPALLPPGPEEFGLDGMPLTPHALAWRDKTPGHAPATPPVDSGGLRAWDQRWLNMLFDPDTEHEGLLNYLVRTSTENEVAIHQQAARLRGKLLSHAVTDPESASQARLTLQKLMELEQDAGATARGFIEQLRVLDPDLAKKAEERRWDIRDTDGGYKAGLSPLHVPSELQPNALDFAKTLGSYDDGHDFGYSKGTAQPVVPDQSGAPAPVAPGYDQGHSFGWSARRGPVIVVSLFGLIGLIVLAVLSGTFGNLSAVAPGTSSAGVTSSTKSGPTANATPATSQGASTAGSSAPVTTTSVQAAGPPGNPVVSASVIGVGRAGRVISNRVSEVITCEVRAWPGATIHGTFDGPWGPKLPSPVTFDVQAGSVFVVNFSGPPYATTGPPLPAPSVSPNSSTAVVQLVLPADVQPRGPATCTITSVSGVPSGSTLAPNRSSWTLTAPI